MSHYDINQFPEKDKNGKPIIGEMSCPSCNSIQPIKLNTAWGAYVFCRQPVSEKDGKRVDCFMRINWGTTKSNEMINQYLDTVKGNIHVQYEDREKQVEIREPEPEQQREPEKPVSEGSDKPATGNIEPEPERSQPTGRSFTAGIAHFFTGDDD